MLSQISTAWAPWYVVPADHKWFSRLATAAVLVTALDAINPRYPAPDPAAGPVHRGPRGGGEPPGKRPAPQAGG
jgi:Polyphosphate kinase 2 (PPK2)